MPQMTEHYKVSSRPKGPGPRPTGTLGGNLVFIFYRKKYTPAPQVLLTQFQQMIEVLNTQKEN